MFTRIFPWAGHPDEVIFQTFVYEDNPAAFFDLIFKNDGRFIMFIPSYEPEIRLQLEIEVADLNFYGNYFTKEDRVLWEAALMMHNHFSQFRKGLRDETVKVLLEKLGKKKFIEFAKTGLKDNPAA